MPAVLEQETGIGQWIARIAATGAEEERRSIVDRAAAFHTSGAVAALHDAVVKLALADLDQADRLVAAAAWVAEALDDDYSRALSRRAHAHACYARARYSRAIESYRAALEIFERLGRDADVARTLSSSLQSLAYIGSYEEAFQSAERARAIFLRLGDRLRLARLDSNVGNILYRQDRYREALDLYQRAYEAFRATGEPRDVAAVLSNMAVCSISLNEFARALDFYREAHDWCERHGMPLLVSEADYNVAYLHYLRGEYTRALDLYRGTREHCRRVGDDYHAALCDLDQSEIYLELNLNREGAELARSAFDSFGRLGMGYEKAKALTNLAVATSNLGDSYGALRLLRKARRLFVAERNRIWPALIDLYRALALYQARRLAEARACCGKALRSFLRLRVGGKAALCELLLGRLCLEFQEYDWARQACQSALRRLESAETPWLTFHLRFVLGRVEEELGDAASASREYREAAGMVERLRNSLAADELKIAFFQDKAAVYESLVWACLETTPEAPQYEAAFAYIEKAKSRSLTDLIAFHAHALSKPRGPGAAPDLRVRELRKDLNCHYHQIDRALSSGTTSAAQLDRLRRQARSCEDEFSRAIADLRAADRESAALHDAGSADLETIRSVLPEGASVLEYFQARDRIYACVLDRKRLTIVPVANASRARGLFRYLQFQLGKFRLGPQYVEAFAEPLRATTDAHLRDLYTELVAPVRPLLDAEHLVVVPHGFLHYLPFHALHDGRGYLADSYTISYAPSSSVYCLCAAKQPRFPDRALVLGIVDGRAPQILDEALAAAAVLPNARLFLNGTATEERLREHGPGSRFIHIATHGVFRQDNPMFSSIRLGGSHLNLLDLYDLDLSSELVTVSGCSTGLSAVLEGDELVGLVRGLLYAGAHGVLVTLWDVHDGTTTEFVTSFYSHLVSGCGKAAALSRAMRDVRDRHPHPYHWAPFALVGNHV